MLGAVTTFAQATVLIVSVLDPEDPDLDTLARRLAEQV
jgi:hypothetical protein